MIILVVGWWNSYRGIVTKQKKHESRRGVRPIPDPWIVDLYKMPSPHVTCSPEWGMVTGKKEEEPVIAEPVYTTEATDSMLEYDAMGHRALSFRYDKTAVPAVKIPEWFVDEWVKTLTISPAEQLIINELQKYSVKWEREISFVDMPKTEKNANYRFDFLLYELGVILEYHGKFWHQDSEKVAGDKLKEEFCIIHGIEYTTYSGKQYYNMEYEISELMGRLGISKY